MNILSKEKYLKLNESIKVSINDLVFIHHPITKDIVKVIIKDVGYGTVDVSIPEDSDYYGQPDFTIKKITIIGKV